jgi:peptidoglycan/xylan/chitin deacetylase (PgdA/CDA1 family)
LPFDVDEAYTNYVTEAWRASAELRALTPGQLGLYYRVKRFVPRSWTLAARRVLIRRTGLPVFPSWPLDESVSHLVRFYAHCLLLASDLEEASFRWFWPRHYRAALILTHDVESAAGLRLAVELADLEESRGLSSSFNVVGGDYPIDHGIVRELSERGFEIGLHGLHHDRSLFSSREEFERQLPRLADAAHELSAEGFRSPATHRVIAWLGELPISYDCSVPHSDPYEPQPGGCCTLWPFFLGNVVELPYTLPQDHTLFTLLRARSVQPWLAQMDAIEQRFGLIQALTHPDPGYLGDDDKRALYAEFLDAVAERSTVWKALPREVAAWWRRRAAADVSDPDLSLGSMHRTDSEPYASLQPPPRSGSETSPFV